VKPKEKEQARALRKQGMSLNEICRIVPAAKSSISLWVRDIVLTDAQMENLRVLCPNCHSQTPYYCGANKQASKKRKQPSKKR
jgi:hypothetical protein